MRTFGALHSIDGIPNPADTVNTLLLVAGTAQAMDWPANTGIARLTCCSTAGAGSLTFNANLQSTGAIVPTSGSSVASSGVSHTINGQQTFQIPGVSTGFSVVAFAPMYVSVECWHK